MERLQVRRLGYALGAEITGIDVSKPLSAPIVEAIRKVWLEHVVLCIPGQDLEPAELVAFCRQFGEVDDNRKSPQNRHPDHDPIMAISNKPVNISGKMTGGYKNGDRWHSDLSYTERPATGSFLVMKAIPDLGGDTMFANGYTAYETLSPPMQRIVDQLQVVYDITASPSFNTLDPKRRAERLRENPPMLHPAARVHPETGRKALFVSGRVDRFAGLTAEESKPILDYLVAHATRHEFVYRHRWSLHDLVIWDNRCALHIAIGDFDQTQLRRTIRCSLLGPKSGAIDAETIHAREAVGAS